MMPVYVFSWRYTDVVDDEFVHVYQLVRTDVSSVAPNATQYTALPEHQPGEILAVTLPDGSPVSLLPLGNGQYRGLSTKERGTLGKERSQE